jgi:uncharacterized protein (DUF1330 family)
MSQCVVNKLGVSFITRSGAHESLEFSPLFLNSEQKLLLDQLLFIDFPADQVKLEFYPKPRYAISSKSSAILATERFLLWDYTSACASPMFFYVAIVVQTAKCKETASTRRGAHRCPMTNAAPSPCTDDSVWP